MILTKYMLKEIFKNQLIILVLLLFICICQKLIKLVGLNHDISMYFIFLYFILSIPELSKLIIPLSLFFSIIISYYRFHCHNEILAMYLCGTKKSFFIYNILLYSLILSCIAFANITWLSPYCDHTRNNLLLEIKKQIYFYKFIEKKIYFFFDKKTILFINKINNKTLQDIIIIKKKNNPNENIDSIITAAQGNIYYHNNKYPKSINLQTGRHYELIHNYTTYSNFYITNFIQQKMLINHRFNSSNKINNIVNHMSMSQLWNSKTTETQIEFHWRLTLLISIIILPIIALLLMINISYNYLFNFLLSTMLYILFFILHILLKSYAILHYPNSIIWIWLVNYIYFITALIIHLWKI